MTVPTAAPVSSDRVSSDRPASERVPSERMPSDPPAAPVRPQRQLNEVLPPTSSR